MLFLLNITHVPTIYVQGTKLEGAEAIDWVQNQREELEAEMYGNRQQQFQQPSQEAWAGAFTENQYPPPSVAGGQWPSMQQTNQQGYGQQGYPQQGYQQGYPPQQGYQQQQQFGGGLQSTGRQMDVGSRYPGLNGNGFPGGPGIGGIGARRPPMQGQPTGNGRMPLMPSEPYDARPPFTGDPSISAGNGGLGGATFDSQFSDPYAPTCPQVPMSLVAVETRGNNAPNLDMAVQQYEQYRDASVYVPPRPMM